MSKFELEQKLAQVQEEQQKLAVLKARLKKFIEQLEEEEREAAAIVPDEYPD